MSITNILDPSRIVNQTSTKIVRKLEAVGNQSISIELYGLNINTHLNLYVDMKKANSSVIQLLDRPGQTFSTNANGSASFVFYYQEDFTQLNNVPEAKYEEFLAKNTGNVLLVVVDKASIDSAELPANYKDIARCYAETYVQRSYAPALDAVHDIIINEIPQTSTTNRAR